MNNTYQLKPISEIAKVITSPVDKKSLHDELPVFLCNYTDVYYNSVISKDMDFMGATAKQSEIDRFSLKPEDVVITKDSESADDIGISTYIESVKDNLLCGYHLTILRPKKNIDGRFLSYALGHPRIGYDFYRYANGITRFGLTAETYKKVKILLPPLPEQKAIADLLSTWDEAIEKTERLIQAKKKQFQRFLHDLIYIPSVNGKWKEVRTKSLFKERRETRRDDLPLLSITNGEGVIHRDDTNRKDTSNNDKSKYLRICPADIGYNTMRMWQGVSALSALEGIVSPAYTICIPGEKLFPQFAAYLFKIPFMIHRFYRYSQGLTSDTWNLKYTNFCEVKMPFPPLPEQKQIAETLSTAQQEIGLLKQLTEKYKAQKRGLMQKLLTGNWRIKPEILNKYKEA
ncbi:MAG: restriction endonuclease subunit S [Candidatus Desulfaltia sp.]|nr:restriction endonuclease subunit S [Candidatus Desulfaltia sp.]